jgi:hypothetical protein
MGSLGSLDEAVFFLNSIVHVTQPKSESSVLPCVLVASKIDLGETGPGGSVQDGKRVALLFGVPFFQHSILNHRDWEEVFFAAIQMGILSRMSSSAMVALKKSDGKPKCTIM